MRSGAAHLYIAPPMKLELTEEHGRDQATQELRFMQAIRRAVPASLDDKASRDYEQREEALLKQING